MHSGQELPACHGDMPWWQFAGKLTLKLVLKDVISSLTGVGRIPRFEPQVRYNLKLVMGCGQVVRHMVLVHAFGGSNPSTPATLKVGSFDPVFCVSGWVQSLECSIRGEKCQWHFARKSLPGNYVAMAKVSGLRNVGRIPPLQP